MESFDVVVIGSGPGGYIGAIRAAQLGLKTACIEKDARLGGTCLNVGCIPSKALLESSYLYHKAHSEFSAHGIESTGVKLNLTQMLARKDKVVTQLTDGVAGLFKKHKITRLDGLGRLVSTSPAGTVVAVDKGGQSTEVQAKHVIIATGSVPSSLPNLKIDEKIICSSTGALTFPAVPKKIVVIGGGVIGLEMGSVWSRLGSDVEVVEFADTIIPTMDEGISRQALRFLEAQGMKFRLKTAVQSVEVKGDTASVTVKFTEKGTEKIETIACDRVLVAVGRKPFTEGLGLDKAGVKTNQRGFIEADANFRTNVPGIYAIGDVIGGAMLAHKAEEEGVALAEMIHGERPKVDYNLVPGIVYTHPELASVGKTEQELRKAGVPYKKGQFSLKANGRAISVGETEGFVKVLAHAETDEILGAHIVAQNASEMIHEFCIAMEFAATAEDLAMTMHGHPTLSEALKEACLAVHGRTLNA